jgi:membrane protein required for colicin V production
LLDGIPEIRDQAGCRTVKQEERCLDHITAIDWLIVGIVVISTLISFMRGFVKEALSLVTLVAAILIARLFGGQVASLLVDVISVPSLRLVAAYGGLYLAVMIIGGMINYLIYQVVKLAGLSTFNRILGMAFGFVRGGLIVVVAVAILGRVPISDDEWWKTSMLIPHALETANWLQVYVIEKAGELTAPARSA